MNLHLDNLSALHPDGSIRLHPVNLTIFSGQVIVVVGQAGAGKSTLLDLAAGLTRPATGNVRLGDAVLWQGKRRNRPNQAMARSFGSVFQRAEEQLFARSVLSEFRYALRGCRLSAQAVEQRAAQALETVGLGPEVLQASPLHLSGGQKRRVAFATTLAARPVWWFLDEPTAGLDPQATDAFAQWLAAEKPRLQGGVMVATHDLDTFLPLADQVVILAQGRVAGVYSPAQLTADGSPLANAGVGLPSALALAEQLSRTGIPIHMRGLDAEATADAIVEALERQAEHPPIATGSASPATATAESAAPVTPPQREHPEPSRLAWMRDLDPRAKWIAYVLISAGMLIDTRWSGVLCSFALTIGLVVLSGVPWRQVWALIRPFLWFIGFASLFSGIHLAQHHGLQVGFRFPMVWATTRHMLPFLFVLSTGILLPATTSHLRLKQGLEQGLSGLKKLGLPIEGFALATSLMLRFVPLITEEMHRFTRIARARGHALRPNGRLSPGTWVAMAIPLLLSLLSLADQLSTAMEARGYQRIGQRRTSSTLLRMQKADALVILTGVCLCGLSMAIRYG